MKIITFIQRLIIIVVFDGLRYFALQTSTLHELTNKDKEKLNLNHKKKLSVRLTTLVPCYKK